MNNIQKGTFRALTCGCLKNISQIGREHECFVRIFAGKPTSDSGSK
jgi:hypothetical protein